MRPAEPYAAPDGGEVPGVCAWSGWRRSRWRGLCAVIGLGSTQDYPDVTGGLRVAAIALNNRQPS